jgi:hypothetical protein
LEYRKRIEVDSNTDYWWVAMGPLNFLNGGCSYPFPTAAAASRFAQNQKLIAKAIHGVDREISVTYPDGTIERY